MPIQKLPPKIKKRYRESIAIAEEAFKNILPQTRSDLIKILINDCEAARTYDWAFEQELRQLDRDALREAPQAAREAKRLAAYAMKYIVPLIPGVMASQLDSGVFLRIAEDDPDSMATVTWDETHSVRLHDLLAALSANLERKFLAAQRGNLIHRTKVGPLKFPKPIDKQAEIPQPDTCLAIFLAFRLKKFSQTGTWTMKREEMIPREGRPAWSVIEQLVTDTLGTGDKASAKDRASKVMNRHPGLKIVGYHSRIVRL
jgi:hypothetical protein